ncbi:MAG: hypothetical protein BWY94_02271 [Actinobacteria bacterium ADurb.BinA094]|nr:MAG: hypothetical protein BWY94_02271 [Actinobacteria bacterium ADurb.BinA094]
MLVVWAGVLARTLSLAAADQWPWYLAGFAAFLALLLLVASGARLPEPLPHLACAAQAGIVLVLLAIEPQRDFVTVLLVLQCYEAAVAFRGLARTLWVATLVTLIGASLVLELGLVHGLALGLVSMAAGLVLSTYVVATQELDAERAASEVMVADLRAIRERLQAYAGQADELAAIEQRAQVAHELEQSVTRTLAAVVEGAGAAQARLGSPDATAPMLERLRELTAEALAQMRRVIAELRPAQE